jgi:ribose-phosphate pyrophosphokinase
MRTPQKLQKFIRGRIVAVVDDLLETGGTLERFLRECKKYGAQKVIALVTHGVLKSGIQRTKKKYAKLYLTNTINQLQTNVDITKLITESLLGND